MASHSSLLLFFLVLIISFSRSANESDESSLPCVKSMMVCSPYLKNATTPSSECCDPLKKVVETEMECLCKAFNNPILLKSFNVTQVDALRLAKACGTKSDASLCSGAAPATSPSATPASVNGSSPPTNSSTPAKSVASRIHGGCLIGVSFVVLLCVSIISSPF